MYIMHCYRLCFTIEIGLAIVSRVDLHALFSLATLALKRRRQKVRDLLSLVQLKILTHAGNAYARVVHSQLLVLAQAVLERS